MEKTDDNTRVTLEFRPDAVVLANGDYPTHPIPLELMRTAPLMACTDGGANEFVARGGVPDIIIGDGDSLSAEVAARFAAVFHRNAEQETNDQTKAVKHLLANGMHSIAIVGATGKREDHTLGNISLLIDYMRDGAIVRSYTDHGMFVPCNGDTEFASFARQQVSVFNFGATGLRAEGLKYPLSDFTNWWQGTLNEATADTFTIHATGDYLVFLTYDRKDKTDGKRPM